MTIKPLILSALALAMCTGAQAQAKPVLLAEAYWYIQNNNLITPMDSVVYKHSGMHNSTVTTPKMYAYVNSNYGNYAYNYDSATIYRPVSGVLQPTWLLAQTFNSFDSVSIFYENKYTNITNTYIPNRRATFSFLSNNSIDSILVEQYANASMTWTPDRKENYIYNADSNVMNGFMWDAPTTGWNFSYTDSTWFDNLGRTIKEKNGSGIYINKYDANNRLIEDTVYAGPMLNYHEYVYDANNNLLIDSSFAWVAGSWNPDKKKTYTYDSHNNLVGSVDYNWNTGSVSYVPVTRNTYIYNSTDQVKDVLLGEKWNNGGWNIGPGVYYGHYYYGPIPQSVGNGPDNAGTMSLYPVPAVAYVNLDLKLDKPQDLALTIINMQGRVVKQLKEYAGAQYHRHISLQELPAGNYILQVKTTDGVMTRNFTVIR